jgi:hypothetical protein
VPPLDSLSLAPWTVRPRPLPGAGAVHRVGRVRGQVPAALGSERRVPIAETARLGAAARLDNRLCEADPLGGVS